MTARAGTSHPEASHPEQWVLGLDGGGSKTALAYVSGAGEVVGPFYAPGINPFDRPDWEAIMRAFLSAWPAPGPLVHASLGLPGYGESPAFSARQAGVCADLLGTCPHSVMNDVAAAFVGAFAGGPGALLLAGTGSMVWADDGARQIRTGGWGEGFGDEGSAYWIGRRALGLASQSLDGRHPDADFAQALLTPVLDGPPTQPDLLMWYHGQAHVRSAVAMLARSVDHLAEDGQPTACTILLEASKLLAQHVSAARQQLGTPDLPWSYAGSVLGSRTVLGALTTLLGQPQSPALPPLGGALFHAASRAGFTTDTDWQARVRAPLLSTSTPQPLLQEQA
ncbi:N-acetylglucosamine kinase [Deinococcus marmoris]|uniref:N-acetylglucosamine kinase of eukaryotic type n=1 Tax=Deinococcus marmoris TaxID=249408 RepID=A0A1U7NTG1_9DEIO|nr:BadF/BadG/BcrA/BcrD ATPase family protein [Deinococcus marmoris]OLV16213.1 N-acetylglucosamine kinase of eukaryotic type [Deinococcus marmoris]